MDTTPRDDVVSSLSKVFLALLLLEQCSVVIGSIGCVFSSSRVRDSLRKKGRGRFTPAFFVA